MSKGDLLAACRYWAREDVTWDVQGPSEARDVGTATHELIAAEINGREAMLDQAITDTVLKQATALFRAWQAHHEGATRAGWQAEVTFAIDVVTGKTRHLGMDLGRDYGNKAATELAGTADLVFVVLGRNGERQLHLRDWKTGRAKASAADARQLRWLAGAAAAELGCTSARVTFSYIDASGVREDTAEMDAFELDLARVEACALAAEVTFDVEPTPGPHCGDLYCPAIATCPRTVHAMAELVPVDGKKHLPLVSDSKAITSSAHAASIYARLSAIDKASESIWFALKEWVREHGPVDLGDGRAYSQVERSRESIAIDQNALRVFDEAFGKRAWEILRTTCTKDGIAELARSVAGAGKAGASLEREVLASLRSVGCVKERMTTSFEATKKRKAVA